MRPILLFVLFVCSIQANLLAQQSNFLFNKTWKIKQYYSEYKGQRFVFYSIDSTKNVLNQAALEYNFLSNGDYVCKTSTDSVGKGKWKLDVPSATMWLDSAASKLIKIDAENLVLRSFSLIYADTSAKLDTVQNFLHFYQSSVITSLDESISHSAINIVPNPAMAGLIRIKIQASLADARGKVTMYDLDGREIHAETIKINKGFNEVPVDLSAIQPGLYYIKVQAAGEVLSEKLVIQK